MRAAGEGLATLGKSKSLHEQAVSSKLAEQANGFSLPMTHMHICPGAAFITMHLHLRTGSWTSAVVGYFHLPFLPLLLNATVLAQINEKRYPAVPEPCLMNPKEDIPNAIALAFKSSPAERYHMVQSLYAEDAVFYHSLVRKLGYCKLYLSVL